jgi:hypothetical protein
LGFALAAVLTQVIAVRRDKEVHSAEGREIAGLRRYDADRQDKDNGKNPTHCINVFSIYAASLAHAFPERAGRSIAQEPAPHAGGCFNFGL